MGLDAHMSDFTLRNNASLLYRYGNLIIFHTKPPASRITFNRLFSSNSFIDNCKFSTLETFRNARGLTNVGQVELLS